MPFPTICLNDKQHRPNEWPTFRFHQNMPGSQQVTLNDSAGGALQLDAALHKVFLKAVSRAGVASEIFCVEGTIVDGTSGCVSFSVDACDTVKRGLFVSSIYVTDYTSAPHTCDEEVEGSSGSAEGSSESAGSESSVGPTYDIGATLYLYKAYVEIEQDWAQGSERTIGVTIAEIRLAMRDLSSEDNFLLDDVEFTDTEIAWAMRRPVDQWNETPPPLSGASSYTPNNFPYRYNWVNAVKGELMIVAASNYRRNHLSYQAAGLSVDDKNKFAEYEKIGRALLAEYKDWILTQKKAINFRRAFGRVELRSYGNYPYNSRGGY